MRRHPSDVVASPRITASRAPARGAGKKKRPFPRGRTVLERSRRRSGPLAPLTPPLAPDRGLALPLPLRARLLVIAALPEFGIQARPLHLPLEAAQRAIEALVVLYDDFQDDHILRNELMVELPKLNPWLGVGNGRDGRDVGATGPPRFRVAGLPGGACARTDGTPRGGQGSLGPRSRSREGGAAARCGR